MIRRFLSGVFWGGVVSALGLGAISQLTPLPVARIETDAKAVPLQKPSAVEPAVKAVVPPEPKVEAAAEPVATPEVEAAPVASDPAAETAAPADAVDQLEPPVGSEFAEPLPEVEPVLPAIEAAPALDTADLAPLAPPASDAASVTDAPSAAPETGLEPPTALVVPAETEVAVVPPAAVEPDQIAVAEPEQPAAPQADVAPAATENPAPAAVEEPNEALLKPLPETLPAPDAEPIQIEQPSPQLDPDAGLESDDENSATLAPTPGLESNVDGVTTGRLPRIGDAVLPEGGVAAPATDAADPSLTLVEDLPPLQKYARSFDNLDAKPLFSIILIDTGGADLDRAALAALPFPVTFALDPLAPEAVAASKIYRDAGQEVIMVATGIPAGATAADLEVTFQAHAAALPETVAVIDTEFGAFQADRPLATQVVPILQAQGRGLISWDRGLNAADQVARREGLAATMVFRKLDGKGENTAAIRRALDRAAFKAAQDGSVTVIGQTIPETVAALLEWAVEGRAATVALAPVSAVLTVQ